MENGTTILFGLPGVAVQLVERGTDERGGPGRLVHVVTTAPGAAGCPSCGVISTSVLSTGRPGRGICRMARSRWPCAGARGSTAARRQPARARRSPSRSPRSRRARLTGRLCRQAARQVASGRSVSAVAAELGVSWPVAHRHYIAHAGALLTEPERRRCWASMRPAAEGRSGSAMPRPAGGSGPSGSRLNSLTCRLRAAARAGRRAHRHGGDRLAG